VIVTHLSLTDFRNYLTAEVALVAGPNLFVGSNGQGKTNLVESLGYLSTLGSHRVSTDHAMIRQGMDSAIIRARLEHGERQILAEVQLNRSGANRAQINRSIIKTRELTRYFSSVLFAPEDLALIRGEPSGRRRFLDELLILRNPRFAATLSDYDRVIRQRNTLLKSARASGLKATQLGTLEIWDDRLVEFGSELITARSALVAQLEPEVTAAYRAVAGADHHARLSVQLSIYSSTAVHDEVEFDPHAVRHDVGTVENVASDFRDALARVRKNEIDRGMTLVGPHRDDLFLELNALPARGYASHGESWSFALALKLASAQLLRRESQTGDPVLMLDDVFAELDQKRRIRLAGAVAGFEQVLITAAVFDDVPVELTGNTIQISQGTIVDTAGAENG
jgi:DNA replication and repair protein RecF